MSLNSYLVQVLVRLAKKVGEKKLHHDLDFAIGSMSDGPLVDAALADFASVDAALWK
jgi:hypothetical protein